MKMEKEMYFLYRYFVIPNTLQLSIYDVEKNKEMRFIDEMIKILDSHKTIFQYWNTRHILYPVNLYDDRLFHFRYAKEIIRKKKVEGEDSIQEVLDNELKSVNIFFDIKYQFVMIQKKTTEFSNSEQVKNAIESYLSTKLRYYNYTLKIDEIPKLEEFWEFIGKYKNISELKLKMNSPNFFFGNYDTRESLSIIKEEFNNDEIEITLKNNKNELNIGDKVDTFINYISTVGGAYVVQAREFGRKISLKSIESIRKLYLPCEPNMNNASVIIEEAEKVQENLNNEVKQKR